MTWNPRAAAPRTNALLARLVVFGLLGASAACGRDPIAWRDPVPMDTTPAAGQAALMRLSVDSVSGASHHPMPAVVPPVATRQCQSSVRVAGDSVIGWYAAWWEVQPDSTAHVMVARSPDGITWGPALRVDSADAGRTGCRRHPPSIAADGRNVHVAYSMAAREGAGIFASHSMDEGRMFHWPVAVVYGDRIGSTAIAARGDLVAVAYEDPNSVQPRIGLALSRTMAHLFQVRQLVSPPGAIARAPDVAIGERGGVIAVSWLRGSPNDEARATMVRIGVVE